MAQFAFYGTLIIEANDEETAFDRISDIASELGLDSITLDNARLLIEDMEVDADDVLDYAEELNDETEGNT